MAGQDHRPLRLRDLRGCELELARVAVHVGPEPRQSGDDLRLGRVADPGLLLERVLGDVDVDRARTAAARDVECLGHDPRQLVRIADQVVVLGHRQRDAVDVDLLERVLADERGRHVAGDRDDRHGVEEGRPDPRDEVGGTRTRGAHADPDPAGHAGVAVRRVRAALLVPDEDVAQLGIVAEDVVEREDDAARVAEEDVDALPEERLAQDVGPDAGPLEFAALVEHLLARALDGRGRRRTLTRHVTASRPGGTGWLRGIGLRGHRVLSMRLAGSAVPDKTKDPRLPARVPLVFGGVGASRVPSSAFLGSPAGSR